MKRGVELSVNFVVILVLAAVSLAFGVSIVNELFSKGTAAVDAASPTIDAQLRQLLRAQHTAVYPASQDVSRGREAQLGFGFRNDGNTTLLVLNATMSTAVDSQNKALAYNLSHFSLHYLNNHTINAGATTTLPIIVAVPDDAPAGTYVLTLFSCRSSPCTSASSDALQKAYLRVR